MAAFWIATLLIGISSTLVKNAWGFKSIEGRWVDTWTSMPQLTESANLPPPPFNASNSVFFNSTIRQTLHMSVGGDEIRLRFSNAFGVNDLQITSATVSLPVNGTSGASAIITSSLKHLTFSGNPGFIVPNGALVVSDPIAFPIKPQSTITVTLYLSQGQSGSAITSHPGSRATSWISFGNFVDAANMTDKSTTSLAHWYFVSAVETFTASASAFVIVGDSITDGRGSDTDKNNRWPDLLLARMQGNSATSQISVNNQAAGGNRILADGLGPNALGRIDRDVLSQSGVKYAMIFEGVNDIGVAAATTAVQTDIANKVIAAFQQIITRVHTAGIPIFAATITPFGAPANESSIQPYSSPIREGGETDRHRRSRHSLAIEPNVQLGRLFAPKCSRIPGDGGSFPLDVFAQFGAGVSRYR
ncbi:SGNH hydrolase [Mycena crocata]|nr:SGNH hydrolase [Mycena crocata]